MNLYDSHLIYNAIGIGYDARTIVYESDFIYNRVGLGYNADTLIYDSGFTYDNNYFSYGGANFAMAIAGTTIASELNRLANRGEYPLSSGYLSLTRAANVWAGTTNLPFMAALNFKNGTVGMGLGALLNSIAGTVGKSITDALRSVGQ